MIAGAARNAIARLDADGSLDADFNAGANGWVRGLAAQTDGRVLVTGAFSMIGAQFRSGIARLALPEFAQQSPSLEGGTVTWLRSGSGAELVVPPQLLFSGDGIHFSQIATFERVAGGWAVPGFPPPPAGETVWLRARGQVATGYRNASTGLIESTLMIRRGDYVFANGFE